MHLLTRDLILAEREARDQLWIEPFDESCLQHTWYWFRLGESFERQTAEGRWLPRPFLTGEEPQLRLERGDCVRIESYEQFRLGNRVLGLIGPKGDFVRQGITLLHGPFIDPLFPDKGVARPLELALVNHSARSITVELCQPIGKVAFFDVGDAPVELDPGSAAAQMFRQRVLDDPPGEQPR